MQEHPVIHGDVDAVVSVAEEPVAEESTVRSVVRFAAAAAAAGEFAVAVGIDE